FGHPAEDCRGEYRRGYGDRPGRGAVTAEWWSLLSSIFCIQNIKYFMHLQASLGPGSAWKQPMTQTQSRENDRSRLASYSQHSSRGAFLMLIRQPVLTAVMTSFLIFGGSSLQAQSEAALRQHFEGRTVTTKLAMPGTEDGVDIYPLANPPMDYPR